MKKYGFGIIGCGVISNWHASVIAEIENAELIGAYDRSNIGLTSFCTKHACRAFATMEEMLACADIDIVCICTPSGTHASLVVAVANAGKNIVVEKPMAITREQLADIVEAVEKNQVQLTSVSQRRFSEGVQKAKEAIDNGKLGRLLMGDAYMKYYRSPEYYASAGWRGTWAMDGGGALMNQGIHGIDILQYLMGPVKSVNATCRTLDRDIEVEDAAVAVVEYQNGAIGIIEGSTCVNPGYPCRIEISGTRGTITLEEDEIVRWDIDGQTLSKPIVKSKNENFKDPTAFSFDNHGKQIKDFIKALENGTRPLIDVYEGKRTVDVILSIYESSETGEKVSL